MSGPYIQSVYSDVICRMTCLGLNSLSLAFTHLKCVELFVLSITNNIAIRHDIVNNILLTSRSYFVVPESNYTQSTMAV
jgi:hypothetical protein